ncbi:MAG: hypothetical protein U1F16_10050 [Turneriella sp.]
MKITKHLLLAIGFAIAAPAFSEETTPLGNHRRKTPGNETDRLNATKASRAKMRERKREHREKAPRRAQKNAANATALRRKSAAPEKVMTICLSRRARLVIFVALSGAALNLRRLCLRGQSRCKSRKDATQSATFYPYGTYGNLEWTQWLRCGSSVHTVVTQNRRIFDGLGNTETIGVTDMMLGADWEINPQFTLDGFYRAGLGANSYQAHEGTATLVSSAGYPRGQRRCAHPCISHIYLRHRRFGSQQHFYPRSRGGISCSQKSVDSGRR